MDNWPQTASAHAGIQHGMVDLGNEPPLGLDLQAEEPADFRRISIRWLAATVLTALSGASLMGGAVYAALDGEYQFASLPEIARLETGSGAENFFRAWRVTLGSTNVAPQVTEARLTEVAPPARAPEARQSVPCSWPGEVDKVGWQR